MLFLQIQITDDGIVNPLLRSIFLPDSVIRLHLYHLQPVKRGHIKFPDRPVVFRRIARSYDDPSLRNPMAAEGLVLEELKHGRRQGFG